MNLTPTQELDLFTSISIPSWISDLPDFRANPAVFLNQCRNNWSFTADQLRHHLINHPELIDGYIQLCHGLIGIHDKVVITREGRQFLVFDQDHGHQIGVEKFQDAVEAATSWLNYRYMN